MTELELWTRDWILYCLMVSLVGAVAVRAAYWLHNLVTSRAAPSWHIPEPGFARATFIAFVVALVGSGVGLALWLYVIGGAVSGMIAGTVLVATSLVTMIAVAAWKLPTSFRNALSVTLLAAVVSAAMASVLLGTFWGLMRSGHYW